MATSLTPDIIVALIAFAGTLLGSLGGILTASRLTAWRLSELEEKVERHNRIIERTFKLEQRVENLEQKARNGRE